MNLKIDSRHMSLAIPDAFDPRRLWWAASLITVLWTLADAALYQAKTNGRNRVVMAGSESSDEVVPVVAPSTRTTRKSP